MAIAQREWRIVFRVFDDRVEIRVPGGYSRDAALEAAQRALQEDGWKALVENTGISTTITATVTRVLRV